MKRIIYILLITVFPSLLTAQGINEMVTVAEKSIIIRDNDITVSFVLNIQEGLSIKSNEVLAVIPEIKDKQQPNEIIELPAVYIAGRKRYIIIARRKNKSPNIDKIIKYNKNKTTQVSYTTTLPYVSSMDKSLIDIQLQLSGCAECGLLEDNIALGKIKVADYVAQPSVAFIIPPKENIKMRKLQGTAYLEFPVNQLQIKPNYKNNYQELIKIQKTIDFVKNDTNAFITNISLMGYASPEGAYQNNARLAQGRAESLKKYILNTYNIPQQQIEVNSIPEDWAGLKRYVEDGSLEDRNDLLVIIDSDASYDSKNNSIQKLGDGTTYAYLLNNIYPLLRRSDYTINYRVKDFDIEESKKMILTMPQQLSLQELYNVSQTYPKGSKEFNHVFKVAVLMYPNDPIANANAASIEIRNGNLVKALEHIGKANINDAAVINNKGVIEMLQNNIDEAERLFIEAKTLGSTDAVHNLNEILRIKEDGIE
ncbi:MAG: hypothetical protein ACRDDZ_12840 [Marinifilaceae bacterium]